MKSFHCGFAPSECHQYNGCFSAKLDENPDSFKFTEEPNLSDIERVGNKKEVTCFAIDSSNCNHFKLRNYFEIISNFELVGVLEDCHMNSLQGVVAVYISEILSWKL